MAKTSAQAKATSKKATSKKATGGTATSRKSPQTSDARLTAPQTSPTKQGVLPRVFIGSSTEGLEIAEAIQANLDHNLDSVIWSQGVFGLSSGTLESLVRARNDFEFAILVLTADDLATRRGRTNQIPRDNVLFELGFFMGALGPRRTFIVHPRDSRLALPSDLAGITPATFAPDRSQLRGALGAACTEILRAIRMELSRRPS